MFEQTTLEFLDKIPFPIMRIESDYQVSWMNVTARTTYGEAPGCCYQVSHDRSQPCDFFNEQCPKGIAEATQEPVSVLHVHSTNSGEERYKVVAVPLDEGGILEWHIPLDDIGAEDCVTGLLTRKETELALTRTLALMQRQKKSFAVVMFDLDHFKSVNDKYGHNVGDIVLSRVGQLLSTELRDSDIIGRWGGEEFVGVLPDIDEDSAIATTERILERIRLSTIPSKNQEVRITISAGVCWAFYKEGQNYQLKDLVDLADKCLYQAKDSGRDCLRACRYPA